ncbi:MAG: hypothetical protein ACW99G_06915 [Candidatus Thorarchaeota archaeon]|jgi:hypothetical protein
MKYKLIFNDVSKINIDHVKPYFSKRHERFIDNPEGEHYKLLSYMSEWFEDELLLDLGTCDGGSALSLAANKKNKVITVDVAPKHHLDFGDFPIEKLRLNVAKIDENHDFVKSIKKAPFIMLDISHNVRDEKAFYALLEKINWKGILVLDDIHWTKSGDMPGFWNSINETKYDITEVGHSKLSSGKRPGTGLVDFSNQIEIIK